ncbi:unnamed protein product [Pleuronectes platessa]|uniref:Uncharacterized protein n=1 Tax=Pleuronectes platessa TaxID=8262 RepID=A0A9N7UEJ8_PLEPL|nr:unnamed protein product [Pleuronectes platessa]
MAARAEARYTCVHGRRSSSTPRHPNALPPEDPMGSHMAPLPLPHRADDFTSPPHRLSSPPPTHAESTGGSSRYMYSRLLCGHHDNRHEFDMALTYPGGSGGLRS